jgi:hypothetical protein
MACPSISPRCARPQERATGSSASFLNDQLVCGAPLYERRERAGTVVTNRTLLYYNSIVLDLPPRKFHSDLTAQMQSVLAALERALQAVATRTCRCTTMPR